MMGTFLIIILFLTLSGWLVKRHTDDYCGSFAEYLGSFSGDFAREFKKRCNYEKKTKKEEKASTQESP